MAFAVCVRRGEVKMGAITSCKACGLLPMEDDDFVYSLVLSDHHFPTDTLLKISADMKSGRRRPDLSPEQELEARQKYLSQRDRSPVFSSLSAAQRLKGGNLTPEDFKQYSQSGSKQRP